MQYMNEIKKIELLVIMQQVENRGALDTHLKSETQDGHMTDRDSSPTFWFVYMFVWHYILALFVQAAIDRKQAKLKSASLKMPW